MQPITILIDPTTGYHFFLTLPVKRGCRYDAERDGSFSLPEHSDTSALSFTVALNDRGEAFSGGGTWFEALGPQGGVVNADIGQAVAFAGPLRHAGYPITSGCRIILVELKSKGQRV